MSWIELVGSVAGILLLSGIAWALGLGGGGIGDAAQACAAAEDALSGFEAAGADIGADGRSALVRGRDGSVAVLKLHGAHLAVRRVDADRVRATPDGWRVETGERRFGDVVVRGAARGN